MLMADEGLNLFAQGGGYEFDDFGEGLSFDAETLLQTLGDDSDLRQSNTEDLLSKNASRGEPAFFEGIHETSQLQNEASDPRAWGMGGLFDSAGNSIMVLDCGKPEVYARIGSPIHDSSASLKDWFAQVAGDENYFPEIMSVSQFEIPTCSTASSFAEAGASHTSDRGYDLSINFVTCGSQTEVGYLRGDNDSKCELEGHDMKHINGNEGNYGAFGENSMGTMGVSENNSCASVEISLVDAVSTQNATSIESSLCQGSADLNDFSDHFFAFLMNRDDTLTPDPSLLYFPGSDSYKLAPANGEMIGDVKDEVVEFSADSPCSSSMMGLYSQGGTINNSVSNSLMMDGYSDIKNWKCNHANDNYLLSLNKNDACHAEDFYIDDRPKLAMSHQTVTGISRKEHTNHMRNERIDESGESSRMMWHPTGVNKSFHRKYPYIVNNKILGGDSKLLSSGSTTHILSQKHEHIKVEEDISIPHKRARHSENMVDDTTCRSSIVGSHLDSNVTEQNLPCAQPSIWNNQLVNFIGADIDETKPIEPKVMSNHFSKVSSESTQSEGKFPVEDDPDICIIEDISHPAPSNRSVVVGNSVASQCSTTNDSHNYMGVGGMRRKTRDEQFIFRVALQDLSQPKSEASPPDGVLAVPLLRHQKIALSWMVQKETASLHCLGGILADDQGLGKTISIIALILKEKRPLSHRACIDDKRGELETLNLDDDDDISPENDGMKQETDSHLVTSSRSTIKSMNPLVQAKGRPAAGTLVVCPTSVLKQWADELQNKVTDKANLSVLMYHGGNRTKDPYELAKYDVVITTYSIVSMEVPKQSLVNGDDEEKGKAESHRVPPLGLSSSKKRKYPPSSGKSKKEMDSALLESVSGPLAKVGWFRVVLDEAQSIKNYRTQVARACWGLRAKRRWCLSGTPIQNAIDDLYSYFRFLKYDPYATYKSFCTAIKVPITRNPSKGYKKLQAVLKTIMLRRTKATLLDGQPIINLPPKFVELKKVDFTKEERDFYSRLEADSRAQFEEYAAAGTVKQNYVNILLMLLRLRQACDHPLLVCPNNSGSLWRSSVDKAKKLSRDKQIYLLNCLEASMAICGICNDPPEDAVVSDCGHVFCKQCICEHLSGDDNQCPTTNCKVHLNMSSVFSKSSINIALSDQPDQDNSLSCSSDSAVFETVEPFMEGRLYESSKIKAALEVLHSLCKPQDCSSRNSLQLKNLGSENSSVSQCTKPPEDHCDHRENLEVDRSSTKKASGEKAIVFSQWTRMLDLLEAYLKNSSIQYRRLDGTMSILARDKAVKDFNTLPEVSVMIMSLKAASLGLNMVAACRVLLLDLWWNPTTEDQAIDRAHRIGQTRPVTVLRLTVKDTVEDRILALQQKKREMVSSAFGEDGSGGRQTRLTVEDLKYLFMM